jgi:hypothetical protein
MPNPRMKQRRVVHKSTAGILKPIPEAVDLVGNPPPALTTKTVAPLQQRGTANRRSRLNHITGISLAFHHTEDGQSSAGREDPPAHRHPHVR